MEQRNHGDKVAVKRFFQILSIGWLVYFLFLFLIFPPYWSRMDDAANLMKVRDVWSSVSFFQAVKDQTLFEITGIGMLRPIYPAFSYFFYQFFSTSPVQAYVALFLLILSIFWSAALIFEKMVLHGDDVGLRYLFLIFCFCFTPSSQLYFHASILEKWVFLSSFLSIGLAHYLMNRSTNPFLAVLLLSLSLGIGFLSKPNVIFVMGPMLLLFLGDYLSKKNRKTLLLSALLLLIVIPTGLYFLSIRGNYSHRYSFFDGVRFFLSPDKRAWLYMGIAFVSVLVSYLYRRRVHIQDLIWPVGVLSFIVVMLPWPGGTRTYYITAATFFLVGTMSIVFYQLMQFKQPLYWKVALCSGLLLFSINRAIPLYNGFQTRTGLKNVSQWIQNLANSAPADSFVVAMPTPCEEVSLSLSYFSGHPGIVKLAHGDIFPDTRKNVDFYMVTLRDCPARPIENFQFNTPVLEKGDWQIYANPAKIYS